MHRYAFRAIVCLSVVPSLLFAMIATSAFADILPDDAAVCQGKAAGAACKTGAGQAGTCVETSVSRPDFGSKTAHKNVTNMPEGFSAASSSLRRARMRSGSAISRDSSRARLGAPSNRTTDTRSDSSLTSTARK